MKPAVTPDATPPPAETSERKYFTYDELVATLPESNSPLELWDGEIVMSPSPSFTHQKIMLRFYEALVQWVRRHRLGEVIVAPMDMVLSPRRSVQPDVAFIAKDRLSIIQRVIRGPADLVAEVISEGEHRRDRIEKRDLYEQFGVKEYWIIDPEAQSVDVLHLEDNQYKLVGRWHLGETATSRLLPGFTVPINSLLAEQ